MASISKKSLLLVVLPAILVLSALLIFQRPSIAELDSEVVQLCLYGDTLGIHEREPVSPEMFDEQGRFRNFVPLKEFAKPSDDYYYDVSSLVLREFRSRLLAEGRLTRTERRLIRRADGKALGTQVSYSRFGGGWSRSSYTCPRPPPATLDLASMVFVPTLTFQSPKGSFSWDGLTLAYTVPSGSAFGVTGEAMFFPYVGGSQIKAALRDNPRALTPSSTAWLSAQGVEWLNDKWVKVPHDNTPAPNGRAPARDPVTQGDWDALPDPSAALIPELPYAPYMPSGVTVLNTFTITEPNTGRTHDCTFKGCRCCR